jgi:putative flippase GtrA
MRSKLGNRITRRVMHAVMGRDLADSQTGLRALPAALLPKLLTLPSSGYEFEIEALIAAQHHGVEVVEHPIRTIYEPGNPSSHFRPFFDSMRIYFVLLRFTLISIVTAGLDNLVFYLLFGATGNVLESQVGGRVLAVLFNYFAVRRAVFLSGERHRILLPRYLLVVASNVCLSYAGIELLTHAFALRVFPAKIVAETTLFLVNFWLQRDFVFTRRTPDQI